MRRWLILCNRVSLSLGEPVCQKWDVHTVSDRLTVGRTDGQGNFFLPNFMNVVRRGITKTLGCPVGQPGVNFWLPDIRRNGCTGQPVMWNPGLFVAVYVSLLCKRNIEYPLSLASWGPKSNFSVKLIYFLCGFETRM